MQPMARWNQDRLVSFTLEATDVDKAQARVCAAAIVSVGGGAETEVHDWLINPGVPIPKESTAIHGITTEHAQSHGVRPANALREINDVLARHVNDGAPVVAFTAPFHLTVLRYESDRHHLDPLCDLIDPTVQMLVIDPAVLDRQIDPFRRGRRTLPALCEIYQVPLPKARTAAAKALVSARLAWRMGQREDLGEMDLVDLHDRQAEWAAEQAEDLQTYFQRIGRDVVVPADWPIIETHEITESAA